MSFPAYPAYKDSGAEWLGEVPEHWGILTAKRLFGNVRESAKPDAEQLAATQAYGVIPQKDFMEKNDVKVVLALSGTESFRGVRANDFVISLRSFQGGIEHSAYDGCVSPAYTVLRRRDERNLNPAYFKYLLKDFSYVSALQSVTTGIREGRTITYEQFGSLPLPVAPVAEQTQIARFLDHETARIDALIEEQQRLIELLKEKRQAVISHAVTKGLDPTVPMKDSGVEWLGEVPAHWVCKSYRYASIIYRGKFSHRPRNDPSLYDGDFAFIQTGDIARAEKYIVEYKQTLNEKGASVSQKFPSGTLVMAIAANVGDTAILGFEAYAPDSVVGFKPERDIELEFLRFSLMAALQELKKTSTQSTQANLNIDRISGIKSVFPPLAEQSAITVYLNEVMERFSLLEKQAEASIELMNERRSALISAAVTGKIDVRGWQPPASTQAPKLEVAEAV
ncbi:restriction endonuclease subunit S [Stutzerimonas degradans]|uniref:restriction endonuclease subunit S n=1 Tax=Stutzerimonas degradans TaxID=2968968 RepID=UPI0013F4ED39|nr:restriction endonuclease subunit S [Stutzerimonas degradans]NHC08727.1 restriction endonuclease subunit S [Stutzerimonas degradans]